MYKITKLIIFLGLITPFFALFSQNEEQPSPLGPGKGRKQSEVGIMFGVGPTWQSGELFASCDCPSFKDGSGFVFSPGIFYQRDISSVFQWGAMVGFTFQTITSSYKEQELLSFQSQTGEVYNNVPVLFREQADLKFTQFNFMPFITFSPIEFAFLRFGFQAGFPFSSNIKHTKELLESKARLDNGETIVISIGNGNQKVLEDGKVDKINALFLALVPAFGFNFHLSGNAFLGFSFAFYYPLNNYTERGNGFKLNYWLVSVDFKYALTMRKWLKY